MSNTCGQRTKEERRAWLKQAQGYPLKLKVELTRARIREWYNANKGEVFGALSGGKDSDVMMDIIWSLYPDVPAVFADTGNELQSVIDRVDRLIADGRPVIKVKPKYTFTEIVKRWGYPVISKEQSGFIHELRTTSSPDLAQTRWLGNKWGRGKISEKWKFVVNAPFKTTHNCCKHLKINPTAVYQKETGKVPFVGTMAQESQLRMQSFIKYSCNAFDQKSPASRPIMFWTEQDVLQYVIENNLPIAKAYGDVVGESGDRKCSGINRTGCKFCLFGVHLEKGENRIQRLARVEPESYRYAIEELGYDKVMDFLGVPWQPFVTPDMQTDMFDERYEVPAESLND